MMKARGAVGIPLKISMTIWAENATEARSDLKANVVSITKDSIQSVIKIFFLKKASQISKFISSTFSDTVVKFSHLKHKLKMLFRLK